MKRLELQGFKSFAAKTVLEFPDRITAIVGPNGSGKSNIVDGMRWVLGERGVKELRGATLENLIFAGTPKRPQASLAKVSFHFDNNRRIFPFDVEEIMLVRKIDRSGASQFFWNDAEAKLKDILPVLAKAKLGSRGITMIGQGQSDLFVKCDSKERRLMIEEILGLKEFRIKKEQAEKRLESSGTNMEKVKAMLDELSPHLRFLRRQKNRFAKREELETALRELEDKYFSRGYGRFLSELFAIQKPAELLEQKQIGLTKEIKGLEENLWKFEKKNEGDEIYGKIRAKITELIAKRSQIEKELAKLEAKFELQRETPSENHIAHNALIFIESLIPEIKKALDLENLPKIKEKLKEWLLKISQLRKPVGVEEETDFLNKKNKYENDLSEIDEEIKKLNKKEEEFAFAEQKINQEFRAQIQHLELRKNELREAVTALQAKNFEKEKISLRIKELEHQWLATGRKNEEFKELIKTKANSPATAADSEDFDGAEAERKMFKLRTELAAIGEIDPALAKEASESEERYNFLSKELKDLDKAVIDLRILIKNLDETINTDFGNAFKSINDEFNKYCRLMFGGGRAKLKITKRTTENLIENSTADNAGIETTAEIAVESRDAVLAGVEIDLNLPGKKNLSLDMLSGGEKSLVSLAALFALIAVSPPPFLVLDEIDAALDDANARRFAELIRVFSKKTQFIIVTHNRATMEAADVLYGITLGEDGTSKILSLKLETI